MGIHPQTGENFMGIETILSAQKPFLKSSEVARIFNVDHSTVFLWVKKRKLHPIRTPGGNFRFARAEVERLFREVRNKDSERRRSPRFQVLFPVKVQFKKDGAVCSYDAFIQDISDKGLGLLVKEGSQILDELISGNLKEISVQNDGVGVLKGIIRGEVRYVHPAGEKQTTVGVLVA